MPWFLLYMKQYLEEKSRFSTDNRDVLRFGQKTKFEMTNLWYSVSEITSRWWWRCTIPIRSVVVRLCSLTRSRIWFDLGVRNFGGNLLSVVGDGNIRWGSSHISPLLLVGKLWCVIFVLPQPMHASACVSYNEQQQQQQPETGFPPWQLIDIYIYIYRERERVKQHSIFRLIILQVFYHHRFLVWKCQT